MSYDGRAVIAEVAARHGWSVGETVQGARDGETFVTYERAGTQVMIAWTEANTATFIAKNYGKGDQVIADGALGLLEARGWMEESV
ncbi:MULTISPECIES: hypothetical protein [Mycolicibacter]|uniref:Uncharacterized protein n=2 Tax=Mycolicibacter TaxID=1073531 RepID=A0ABU5XPM2_9MYCO|nr:MULTISPECIES: hypothetical protein [unclassified Mycolicibacter]MEB3023036.1 hypothetical protein [Mycolicibacter sp. MYC098]MEB3033546.1 hypothetical protein [Mycolicibacter sp. MYC340]